MLLTFVTIYDFQQVLFETRGLVCPESEKLTFDRGSQASAATPKTQVLKDSWRKA
jgi:hypothetical protein